MKNDGAGGKLEIKNGAIVCPWCGCRLPERITPRTRAEALGVWCKRCRRSFEVNIDQGQCHLCPC